MLLETFLHVIASALRTLHLIAKDPTFPVDTTHKNNPTLYLKNNHNGAAFRTANADGVNTANAAALYTAIGDGKALRSRLRLFNRRNRIKGKAASLLPQRWYRYAHVFGC